MKPQFIRENHGSLYNRGSADSWYRRPSIPHWWPQGTGCGDRITMLTPEERAEYNEGYDANEDCGDHKDWD